MTALLFLIGAWLVGAWVVRRALPRLLDGAEQALCGLVAGWMLATLAAYAVARSMGRLEHWPLVALTAALCAAACVIWAPELRRARRRPRPRRSWLAGHAGLLLVFALFAPVLCQLFSTRMLAPGDGGVYSGGNTWYDLGFHLALTTSFLYGQNYPPVSPSFPPAPLHYPLLPDFLTAALVALGMSLRAALVSTGVALSLAVVGLIYTLARRVSYFQEEGRDEGAAGDDQSKASEEEAVGHAPGGQGAEAGATGGGAAAAPHAAAGRWRGQAAAALATALFLLNGGFGFLYLFADWRGGGRGLSELLWRPPANYANLPEQQIHWTNLVADTLLPQRTSLFGLPVALIVITLFASAWRGWSRGEGRGHWPGWRPLVAAGCLAGLLPLFHIHSYAAVGLVSGFLFLLRPRRAWLAFWAPAVLLALPSFLGLSAHAAASGFVRLQPGWRGHAEANWPLYWLRNVGPVALLIVPAWVAAPPLWRRFYLAFALLLAFSLVVVVSPNDYDNIKLMFYWYALTAILVADWLVRLACVRRGRPLAAASAALLALASTASGLLALRHEAASRALFLSDEALAAAEFVRRHTAPRALFLAAPDFQQPAWALAGRPTLRGEYLWHHGDPYQEREADVRRIYAGADDALELLRHYRLDYVYLGEREKTVLGADEDFFARHFPVLYRSPAVAIYDVRRPGDGDGAAGRLAPYPPREFATRLDKDPAQLLVEFPRAAFSVYRYYKVARGRWPEYREFMEDLRAVGSGVYVGAEGWERRLEANKLALTDAWPAREEFRRAFDGLGAAEFVQALYANAGVELSRPERERLAAALEAGAETRASVLRHVAEERELFAREYDAAYVLAHYFGYLRRGPADPPDKDLEGFDFWLRILRRTHDYRSVTRVFIESGEYKDRRQ